MKNKAETRQPETISQSLNEYGRGIAGGLLFSLPLLYTQEMWDWGMTVSPERMLLALLFTFALLLGYNHFAGLRHDASWLEVVIDSVEEYGIGLLLAGLLLWLMGRVAPGMHHQEVLGIVLIESMIVAIGVSVGTAQLGGARADQNASQANPDTHPSSLGSQVVLGACGAFLLVGSIAPTEEVVDIGSQADLGKLAGLALFSMLLAALVLYFSDFVGTKKTGERLHLAEILRDTLVTYAVALTTSAAVLWFFGRLDGETLLLVIAHTVVTGFPAVMGASAGRLLLTV
jgi:putative integral membrane protein (TIGR02587 family)